MNYSPGRSQIWEYGGTLPRMLDVGFYVHGGKAYIPVHAKTEAGFYLQSEPVEVVAISDTEAFTSALKRVVARGNPTVPTPQRDALPRPVVLKYAKLRAWSRFEKEAAYWEVSKENGWIFGPWKRRMDKGWEPDPSASVRLQSDCSAEHVIRLVVSAVQHTA